MLKGKFLHQLLPHSWHSLNLITDECLCFGFTPKVFYYSTKVFTEAGLNAVHSREATCGIGAVSIVMTLIVVSVLVLFFVQTFYGKSRAGY